MQYVFIVGSKGIPANYGGFETFVEKLTKNKKDKNIHYYVACTEENSFKSGIKEKEFRYNCAECFSVSIPNIGPAKAIYYDVKALKIAIQKAKELQCARPIFYVLACRIGPFITKIKKEIEKINGILYVNPDGHEWLRKKWSLPVRKYWKISEKLMVKEADLLICDSKNIEKYIKEEYREYHPKTKFIAYGTDLEKSRLESTAEVVRKWYNEKNILENNYYLVVGRFVPENNYETMIREFMKSNSRKDFVLITNLEKNKFYERLKKKTNFDKDSRIKFVGTVYNHELLKYIRENAFAYFHGHEVGGTNPSLLEALGSTKLNLLLDVGFNREVAENSAIYWKKTNLHNVIKKVETYTGDKIKNYDKQSYKRIEEEYSWEKIVREYEEVFDIGGYND